MLSPVSWRQACCDLSSGHLSLPLRFVDCRKTLPHALAISVIGDEESRQASHGQPKTLYLRELEPGACKTLCLPRRPADLDMASNPILRIHYTGNVARLTLNGRLLNDDFYNGSTFEISLRRYASELASGDLRLEILPLQKNTPIYFEPKHRPEFHTDGTALRIDHAEIQYTEPQTPTRLAANNPAPSGFE